MRHVNYWRHGEWIGNDTHIGEFANGEKDGRCPFCHSKVSSLFYMDVDDGWEDDDGNLWEVKPIGCFRCMESSDDEEDEFYGDCEPYDWEMEARMECRGTAYEY